MKMILTTLAAGAALWPGLSVAQDVGVAGVLPNTFDPPAAAAPAAALPQTPAASSPEAIAAAEAMLRTTIAAMQAGTPNYDAMTPTLAEKVREQADGVTPLIRSFGDLQSVTHIGHENNAELFAVVFSQQPTQWLIGLSPAGKITALLFRPG